MPAKRLKARPMSLTVTNGHSVGDSSAVPELRTKAQLHHTDLRLSTRQKWTFAIYVTVVLVGTIVQHLVEIPPSSFSDKRNPLNTIFVKMGWVGTRARTCVSHLLYQLLFLSNRPGQAPPLFSSCRYWHTPSTRKNCRTRKCTRLLPPSFVGLLQPHTGSC